MSEHQSIGGEANRDGGPAPNWGGRQDGWSQAATKTPAVPEAKPADAGGGEELFSGLDESAVANMRDQLARKLSTPEELQRIYGLSPQELAALVEGKAPISKAASEATNPDGTAAIETELKGLRALRSANPQAYWNDTNQRRELELLQALSEAKEGASQDAPLHDFVDAVRSGLEDATDFESAFNAVFPTLPSEDQDRIRQEVAFPTEPARPASEKEIAAFAERPEGRQLIDEWGRAAPQRVAAFQARLKAMVRADSTGKLAGWFSERSPAEAASIARALAR
jgi:hypothetical protein